MIYLAAALGLAVALLGMLLVKANREIGSLSARASKAESERDAILAQKKETANALADAPNSHPDTNIQL